MNEIYERSPTRVDLAGGTLDCWPLYLFLDNPVTINVAIDIFTHCHLQPRHDQTVELISEDLGQMRSYGSYQEALLDEDPAFALYRAFLRFYAPPRGLTLRTRSESPVGAGLGGSSSLCISMMKAFSRWLQRSFAPDEMVRIASHLEAQVLLKPTGTQDYFPPIYGGLCFIEYGIPGPSVRAQAVPREVFERRFLLVYTGKAHHSGINNWHVIKQWLDGDEGVRRALRDLAAVSQDMRAVVESKRWGELPALFQREYVARTALSEGFSSPEIRRLQQLAERNGAVAKICGAGGGGCVLIWCADQQVDRVRDACVRDGFQVLPARPWESTHA